MQIGSYKVGWEKVTPLEEFPEVTCEIRRLSLAEKMDFLDTISHIEQDKFTFGGKDGREMFRKYVRNIEGIEWAGRKITRPDELLDPDMPPDDGIIRFITSCVAEFWVMQFPQEEEIKKSEPLSENEGSGPTGQPSE